MDLERRILCRAESLFDVVKRKMRGYIGASSGLHSAVPLCSSIHDVMDTRSVRIICILFACVFLKMRNRGFAWGNMRLYSSNDASNRQSSLVLKTLVKAGSPTLAHVLRYAHRLISMSVPRHVLSARYEIAAKCFNSFAVMREAQEILARTK